MFLMESAPAAPEATPADLPAAFLRPATAANRPDGKNGGGGGAHTSPRFQGAAVNIHREEGDHHTFSFSPVRPSAGRSGLPRRS